MIFSRTSAVTVVLQDDDYFTNMNSVVGIIKQPSCYLPQTSDKGQQCKANLSCIMLATFKPIFPNIR